MNETQSEPSQQTLDLTLFSKELFSEHATFDLEKNPNADNYFEPIPNGFYGFCIPIVDLFPPRFYGIDTIDIDFEDVTHKKIA